MQRALALIALLSATAALPARADDAAGTPIERALATLSASLEEAPLDSGLLTDYGNLLVRAGRLDEAAAAYESAATAAPGAVMPLYDLGLLRLERRRFDEATQLFRRALEIDPDFALAEYGLGAVLEARGRSHRAVQHYARAFTLDPELLDVESHPELLFNDLATWASTKAYLESGLGRGTRLYANPRPIVGLLMPTATVPPAEEPPMPVEGPPGDTAEN